MRRLWILVILTLLTPARTTTAAAQRGGTPGALATPGTPTTSLSCGARHDQGLIAYQMLTFDQATPGTVTGAVLVVTTPDGQELHRIVLPDYAQLDPLGVGCAMLVSVDGHGSMLVNPVTGSETPLDLPGKRFDRLVPAPWWQRTARETRWAFVSDGTPQSALLLDTQTGRLTDLTAVIQALRGKSGGGLVLAVSAQFNADESHFLLVTDQDAWVMPTGNPRSGRRLAEATLDPASFSADGRQILYVQTAGQDKTRVVVQHVDGSGTAIVAGGDRNTFAYWVPGSGASQVLLLRLQTGRVSLVRIPDRLERDLLTLPPATPARPFFAPSGRRLLIRAANGGQAATWIWVDLATRKSHPLDALTGYRSYSPVGPGIRWVALASFDVTGQINPGSDIRGLDLETGTMRRLLVFAGKKPYLAMSPTTSTISADGRFSVVNDLGANYPGFWLLDAAQGTSHRFSGRLCSAFSPDGGTLLVSVEAGNSKPPRWRIMLMATNGTDERTLAASPAPGGVWVPLPWSIRS